MKLTSNEYFGGTCDFVRLYQEESRDEEDENEWEDTVIVCQCSAVSKALIGSVRVGSVHAELRPDPNST